MNLEPRSEAEYSTRQTEAARRVQIRLGWACWWSRIVMATDNEQCWMPRVFDRRSLIRGRRWLLVVLRLPEFIPERRDCLLVQTFPSIRVIG